MRRLLLLLSLSFLFGCGGSSTGGTANPSTLVASVGSCSGNGDGNNALPSVSGNNVMNITINRVSICSYNQPCTSVTICEHGTSTCTTVSNLLVDTGSYGLRVFRSALGGLNLTPQMQATKYIGECMYFGSANTWGQVMTADVTMGNEPTISNLSIQVIDTAFASIPGPCTNPFSPIDTPAHAGFNGILGVGLGVSDCGSYCADSRNNNQFYFACAGTASGSSCSSTALAQGNQVQNPVYNLPTDGLYHDNNGVIIQLPSINPAGVSSVTGNLILGINTRGVSGNNKIVGSPKVFYTDLFGNFTTNFAGVDMSNSFIDSGSNGFFFPQVTQTPSCKNSTDFFCPDSSVCLAATMKSYSSSTQTDVSFLVANTDSIASGVYAINGLSGDSGDTTVFDWGLPFFYGRTVYTGISGMPATGLGTGPYWAF